MKTFSSTSLVSKSSKTKVEYITTQPSKELDFQFAKDRYISQLYLTNKSSDKSCIFKVRSTAATLYAVSPTIGILKPLQTQKIKFQIGAKNLNVNDRLKDRFLVQAYGKVQDPFLSDEIIQAMFQNLKGEDEIVQKMRFGCYFEKNSVIEEEISRISDISQNTTPQKIAELSKRSEMDKNSYSPTKTTERTTENVDLQSQRSREYTTPMSYFRSDSVGTKNTNISTRALKNGNRSPLKSSENSRQSTPDKLRSSARFQNGEFKVKPMYEDQIFIDESKQKPLAKSQFISNPIKQPSQEKEESRKSLNEMFSAQDLETSSKKESEELDIDITQQLRQRKLQKSLTLIQQQEEPMTQDPALDLHRNTLSIQDWKFLKQMRSSSKNAEAEKRAFTIISEAEKNHEDNSNDPGTERKESDIQEEPTINNTGAQRQQEDQRNSVFTPFVVKESKTSPGRYSLKNHSPPEQEPIIIEKPFKSPSKFRPRGPEDMFSERSMISGGTMRTSYGTSKDSLILRARTLDLQKRLEHLKRLIAKVRVERDEFQEQLEQYEQGNMSVYSEDNYSFSTNDTSIITSNEKLNQILNHGAFEIQHLLFVSIVFLVIGSLLR